MIISVASNSDLTVAQHFGHCDCFLLYTVEEGKVVKMENVPNPGHRPGFLPNFLADHGAKVIIAGGMGGGAVDIFEERGVQVVTGASGSADEAVKGFVAGTLVSSGSICHEHQHHDENCR
jgi:Uncharacterized conserved protein